MSLGMALLVLALALPALWPQDPVHPDLAELTPRWEEAMRACGVPALAMVLVEGGEVVHRVTLGRRDPARAAPVTKDTIFYIASATKPYVAFALAQLAEQGKLELDAPVARYLPRFRLADPELTRTITVRDLLCHRHGLNSREIVLLDAYTGEITEDRYYRFLERVESPGRVEYTNVHFTLAGRVIEAVSGLSWRDYLARHVFEPAGMTRTTGYADWMYAQDDVAIPAVVVDGRPLATPVRKSDRTMHAAGGLGTSIDDLGRWLLLQLGRGALEGRRILSERGTAATWELTSTLRDEDPLGPSEGYALGWRRSSYRGHLGLNHGGGYVGSASWVHFLPELGLGLAVVATGGEGASGACALVASDVYERLLADDQVRDLLPRLLERARGAERAAPPGAAAAPRLELARPLADYAGSYANEWLGTLTLTLRAGRLEARLGELALALATSAPERVSLDSEGPLRGEGAFELSGGKVVALTLELEGIELGGSEPGVRFAR
jgi:CubicO group peptidase (beta-lactamase class C family)